MYKLRDRISNMISLFFKVVTLVCVASALYVSFFCGWNTEVNIAILWQILFVSALCSFVSNLFHTSHGKELSKEQMRIRTLLSFLYVNCVVLGCGFYFRWFYISEWGMVLGMEIMIIIVFMIVSAITHQADSKMADKLNSRLQERKK